MPRDKDTENENRREEARRVRIERIINGHVKACYPEIYVDSYKFYQHLDSLHPQKKDLRKTPEFRALKRKSSKIVKTSQPIDNMVLKIPLMVEKTTTETSDPTPSTVVETSDPTPSTVVETSDPTPSTVVETSDPTPSTVVETSDPTPSTVVETSDPTPSTVVETSDTTPSTVVETSDPTPSTVVETSDPTPSTAVGMSDPMPLTTMETSDLPFIDENLLQEVINELRMDPNMQDVIFDDMDLDFDNIY